jgi:GT2 family glycosyltransferase
MAAAATNYPLVSVLIVNYNGMWCAQKCLESIRNQRYPNHEVLVLDNASSDGSARYIRANFPEVRIMTSATNMGFAKAANGVANEARGEYLLFLNMDTWFEGDLLEALVSGMREDPNLGICGCTQLSYDSSKFLNSGSTTDFLGYPVFPDAAKGILYADGASLFVKKTVFKDLGGFDSQYFMYGEEVDLCWRALVAGYDVAIARAAIVRHSTGGTVVKPGQIYEIKRFRRYLYERNSLRTLLKNYSLHTLFWVVPARIVVMSYEFLLLTGTSHMEFALDIARAITWNFWNLRETIKLRRSVQDRRKVSDKVVMSRMRSKLAIVMALAEARKSASKVVWK